MDNFFVSLGFGREENGLVEREEKETEIFEIMRVNGWLGGVMVS